MRHYGRLPLPAEAIPVAAVAAAVSAGEVLRQAGECTEAAVRAALRSGSKGAAASGDVSAQCTITPSGIAGTLAVLPADLSLVVTVDPAPLPGMEGALQKVAIERLSMLRPVEIQSATCADGVVTIQARI